MLEEPYLEKFKVKNVLKLVVVLFICLYQECLFICLYQKHMAGETFFNAMHDIRHCNLFHQTHEKLLYEIHLKFLH